MHCNKPFHFTLCIEGDIMSSQVATFTLTVNPTTPNPIVLTPAGGALPTHSVGDTVSDPVTHVSGGVAPYTFAITNGAVPDGLQLTAVTNADSSEDIAIEGIPTVAGDFSFDLTVTDSGGSTTTASLKRSIR
jgi:hypothetical protein